MLPYKERKIGLNKFIRKFSKELSDDELYWHKDKEDRIISKVSGSNWLYQEDNCLPIKIDEKPIFIKKNTWHRIIKGSSDLIIEVEKVNE